MFGQTWYFSTIRKYVILVGTLFNDLHITRIDKDGNQTQLIKVPITYGPKDKMLARTIQDPNIDRQTATLPLPMISFEMGKMTYDGTRKLPTINRSVVINDTASNDKDKFKYQYNPVPYNIQFKVFIYAKNAEDGTKIIEQVLPFFTPDWTTTIQLIPEMGINMDIPIILNNINYSDNYDGDFKNRRAIIWELDLLLKGYFYGPVKRSAIIKFINLPFYIPSVPDGQLASAVGNTGVAEKVTVQPGLTANGQPINYYGAPANTGTIPYTEINANDDYGFITTILNAEDLEG